MKRHLRHLFFLILFAFITNGYSQFTGIYTGKPTYDILVKRSGTYLGTINIELFPNIAPRPLQIAIDEVSESIFLNPCLAVIEAPTGEGKTEAALALAHRIAQFNGTDEFYYALPTTATSNQMFGRLQEYLLKRLNLPTQINLIHGQAFLYQDDLRIQPLSNGNQDEDDAIDW